VEKIGRVHNGAVGILWMKQLPLAWAITMCRMAMAAMVMVGVEGTAAAVAGRGLATGAMAVGGWRVSVSVCRAIANHVGGVATVVPEGTTSGVQKTTH
jgi:hypothetical protein